MFVNPKKWIIAGLVVLPLQAMAGTTAVSFGEINVNGTTYSSGEPSSNFNQFTVSYGTAPNVKTINVSAWSDTAGNSGTNPNKDPYIERAVDLDRNNNGWALINTDESPTQSCGYHHSADNFSCSYTDYDFFVLDFGSTDVELTSVHSSWNYNAGANDTQVSVAAIDPNFSFDGSSMADLLAANGGSQSSTFQSGSSISSYYADVNTGVSSNLWVVSAYHTMFGTVDGAGTNNDGFKFAGINFKESSSGGSGKPIPEPSTMAILALALFGLSASRRKV